MWSIFVGPLWAVMGPGQHPYGARWARGQDPYGPGPGPLWAPMGPGQDPYGALWARAKFFFIVVQNGSRIGRGWSQRPPGHFWGTFGTKHFFLQTELEQIMKHPHVWKSFFLSDNTFCPKNNTQRDCLRNRPYKIMYKGRKTRNLELIR